MVRYTYICNEILKLYRAVKEVEFPIDPLWFFQVIENCRVMTYQEMAAINGSAVSDIITLCESSSGCTHYSMAADRYLTLYNASHDGNNVEGRIRWTKAHELGHVALNHLQHIAVSHVAENNFNSVSDPELEKEADYFAANLLSPFPAFQVFNIHTLSDIQIAFGLSEEAAKNRMAQYIEWRNGHRKTAWENDIRKLLLKNN